MASVEEHERVAAWVSLIQAQSVVVDAVSADLMARRSLPLPWHEVLVRLDRADQGAMRMQELARSVLLSKSGLTRLVDRMEEAGLVERAGCPTDRRGTFAAITPKGRQTLEAATPVFLESVHERFGRHLTDEEVRVLSSALRKLVEPAGEAQASECNEDLSAQSAAESKVS